MALTLTAADLDKLKSKELANAIRKLHEGKTLTNAERALLASASIESASSTPSGGGFAGNWNELAERLGVSRRAIQEWRKDPRYSASAPVSRVDGRHDVAAWAEFMVRHGLKRADEFVTGHDGEDDTVGVSFPQGCEADWKKKLLEQKVAHAEIETGKLRGTLLIAAELETPLGATLVAVTNKLTQFPERVAPLVTGFTDVLEVIEILRTEVEADITILHAADYITDVDRLVGELPTDPETARLLQLVSFAGQDQASLRQLIVHCTHAALRRIGARATAAALAPPVQHAVTGQVTDQAAEEHAASNLSAASDPPAPAVSRFDPGKLRSSPAADFSDRTAGKPSNPGKPCKGRRRGTPARAPRAGRKAAKGK